MLMFEWILVLLLAAVILTNLAERLAVPYPSLLAIAGVGEPRRDWKDGVGASIPHFVENISTAYCDRGWSRDRPHV